MAIDKPRTAWELCEMVCEAIERNPLNYYQEQWHARRGSDLGFDELPSALDVPANECGTAFCRGGWMLMIAHGHTEPWWESCGEAARRLLGMPRNNGVIDDVDFLFGASALDSIRSGPGTPEYVAEGVRGMREFMTKHEAHLKAHVIPEREV